MVDRVIIKGKVDAADPVMSRMSLVATIDGHNGPEIAEHVEKYALRNLKETDVYQEVSPWGKG